MKFWSRLMQGFRSIDLNPHVVTMPADQLADLWENGTELIRPLNSEPEETP